MDNHMDNNPNGNGPDNKGPGKMDPNKNHQSILAFLVCLLITLVCFAMFTNMLKDNSSEISYQNGRQRRSEKSYTAIRYPDDCAQAAGFGLFGKGLLYQSDGVRG